MTRESSGDRLDRRHLIVAPIVLPLLTAALMLLLGDGDAEPEALVNLVSSVLTSRSRACCCCNWTVTGCRAPSASTCRRTGTCRSASCWSSTGCRR